MNPPRRDWGKAIVMIPYAQPLNMIHRMMLPRDYELDEQYGQFFMAHQSLSMQILVTGPDIPVTDEGTELPVLKSDAHTWQGLVVYPYEHV